MVETVLEYPIDNKLAANYFNNLVNHFFKILPIRESESPSLPIYIRSLQKELFGCGSFVPAFGTAPEFLILLSVLQYLAEHPTESVEDVRREVFRAISICKKISKKYEETGVGK